MEGRDRSSIFPQAVNISCKVLIGQRRYELTDFEWSGIKPLLPSKPRGLTLVKLASSKIWMRFMSR
jgi:hypothetical protein